METYKITLNEAQAKAIMQLIKLEVSKGATLGFEKTMSPVYKNLSRTMKAKITRNKRNSAFRKIWNEARETKE